MVDCDVDPTCEDDAASCAAVLYANTHWRVTHDGIEHPRTGYVIDRSVIDRRRGDHLWEWPLHMAEKTWCEPRPLKDAFVTALDRYGIAADPSLMRSFAIGFGLRFANGDGSVDRGFESLGEVASRQRHGRRKGRSLKGDDAAWRRDEIDHRRSLAVAGG